MSTELSKRLHSTTDARVWAAEWCKIASEFQDALRAFGVDPAQVRPPAGVKSGVQLQCRDTAAAGAVGMLQGERDVLDQFRRVGSTAWVGVGQMGLYALFRYWWEGPHPLEVIEYPVSWNVHGYDMLMDPSWFDDTFDGSA